MDFTAENYRALRERGGIADLSDRVRLQVTGSDRVRYLNGQVTANVQAMKPGEARPACVTTPKGRLCAEIMITAAADAFWIDADLALAEALPPRLERYIIADDVTIAEAARELRLVHLIGGEEPSAEFVERSRLPPISSRRFGHTGWDLWIDDAELQPLWSTLNSVRILLNAEALEMLRIESGMPRWGKELTEETLPPEAGLDRTHIDYHKGCYVGQEVISRLKSVGHVNRRLAGFLSTTGQPLSVGSSMFAAGDFTAPIGTLTSTTWSFALEKYIALGYLKRSAPTTDLVARGLGAGAEPLPVATQELPFIS